MGSRRQESCERLQVCCMKWHCAMCPSHKPYFFHPFISGNIFQNWLPKGKKLQRGQGTPRHHCQNIQWGPTSCDSTIHGKIQQLVFPSLCRIFRYLRPSDFGNVHREFIFTTKIQYQPFLVIQTIASFTLLHSHDMRTIFSNTQLILYVLCGC